MIENHSRYQPYDTQGQHYKKVYPHQRHNRYTSGQYTKQSYEARKQLYNDQQGVKTGLFLGG